MIGEFRIDLAFLNPNILLETSGFGVYHKMIRTTFEHKVILLVEIWNNHLTPWILNNDNKNKDISLRIISLKFYCLLFISKLKDHYADFFYKGNNVHCEFIDLNLIMTIESDVE